jgi:hypothetical protein
MTNQREHMRAGSRINSRVAVALEWTENGKVLRIEAQTIDISSAGCLIAAPQPLTVGQLVQITNLANYRQSEGQIVRHGQARTHVWELAIRFREPNYEFWGLDL